MNKKEKEKYKGLLAFGLIMFLLVFTCAYAGVGYSVMSGSAFLGYLFSSLIMFFLLSLIGVFVKVTEKTKKKK